MKRSTKIILAAIGALILGATALVMFGLFCVWQLVEGTRLYNLGYDNLLQKDYDGAIKNLTDASSRIVIGENRFWLYVNRGSAEMQKKRYDDAIKDFTEAIEIDPSRADPYERRGDAYERKKEIDKALADYDRALERDPNEGFARLHRGTILYDRNEFDKALTDFQEVVRIWPNYAHGFVMRGRCYFKQEEPDYEHALSNFDTALKMEPGNRKVYEERGQTYLRLGDSERAFFDSAEAQHLAPQRPPLQRPRPSPTPRGLGLTDTFKFAPLPQLESKDRAMLFIRYSELLKEFEKALDHDDYDGAIAICNKVLALDLSPAGRSLITMQRGSCYWRKGEFERADQDYDEALKIDPRNARAYIARGLSLTDRGELDDALEDYAEAIRVDPRAYLAYCYRGFTFFFQGDFKSALTDFGKAMEIDPSGVEAYVGRGDLYCHQKIFSKALADYAMGIEFHPDSIYPYLENAYVYLKSGDFPLAEQNLKTARGVARHEDIALHSSVAWVRSTCPDASLRNRSEALAEAKRSCEMVHWKRWGPLDTLAAAEAEAGDFGKAIEYEERALQMPVPPILRPEVEARLTVFRQHLPFRERAAN